MQRGSIMFTLVFSWIAISSFAHAADSYTARLQAIYQRDAGAREALTDEALEKIFRDTSRRTLLIEFEKEFHENLNKTACTLESSQAWYQLAEVEVDLFNLDLDTAGLTKAIESVRM